MSARPPWMQSATPTEIGGGGDHVLNLQSGTYTDLLAGGPPNGGETTNITLNLGPGIVGLDVTTPVMWPGYSADVTVNLAKGTDWIGTLSDPTHYSHINYTIKAGDHTWWTNDGDSNLTYTSLTVPVDVIGKGTFEAGFALTFMKGVSAGQEIKTVRNIGGSFGTVVIDDPKSFHGTVNLASGTGQGDWVQLNHMSTADSYTYQNDMLSLFHGNQVIEQLHLTGAFDGIVMKSFDGQSVTAVGGGAPLPAHFKVPGNFMPQHTT